MFAALAHVRAREERQVPFQQLYARALQPLAEEVNAINQRLVETLQKIEQMRQLLPELNGLQAEQLEDHGVALEALKSKIHAIDDKAEIQEKDSQKLIEKLGILEKRRKALFSYLADLREYYRTMPQRPTRMERLMGEVGDRMVPATAMRH